MKKRAGRRYFSVPFFILFFILFFFGAADAAALRISIPDAVRVRDDACALSEIADISGPREPSRRAGELLLTIKNGVITREQVIEALRVSGLQDIRVELQMPKTVRAEKAEPGAPLRETGRSSENLADLIKSLAAWEGDVEVQYQGGVPAGRLVSPASIVPGTAAATLKFRGEDGGERSLAVRLTWTQRVLVLTRSLKKGDVLKEADVTVRSIRVNRPGVYASKFSEVAGKALTKNVPQGEPLALNLVALAPIIERGKSVTIVARSGGLVVRTKGEALESGALGDVIRVRNTSSRTVLSVVVTANDTVEVSLP